MPWFRIDDAFWGHAKRLHCSNSAIGLWAVAGAWSAQQLTDGFVPHHVLAVLQGKPKDCTELVDAGLWTVETGGWRFHDWGHFQRTRAEVEADREAARQRMKRARNGRRIPADVPDEFDGSSDEHDANFDRSSEGVTPTPTLPSPALPSPALSVSQVREVALVELVPAPQSPDTARGHRLPNDWQPGDNLIEWARAQQIPDAFARSETAKFRDHWLAQPGLKGRKTDWDATWRNWVRRAAETHPRGKPRAQQETDDLFDRAARRMGVAQ